MNTTLIELASAPGRRVMWSSGGDPMREIISMECGIVHRFSEVRCVAVDGVGALRVMRGPDGSVILDHPAGMIVGYVRDGVRHGDQRLWEDISW